MVKSSLLAHPKGWACPSARETSWGVFDLGISEPDFGDLKVNSPGTFRRFEDGLWQSDEVYLKIVI